MAFVYERRLDSLRRAFTVGWLRDGFHLDGFAVLWVQRCVVRA